jgi:hypothetical protein
MEKRKNSLALFYVLTPVSARTRDGRERTESGTAAPSIAERKSPRILLWLSAFHGGRKNYGKKAQASPAFRRAFLRRMLSLQKISDRKGPLWKPLAAYAAIPDIPGGKGKRASSPSFLDFPGAGLDAHEQQGRWVDWLMRRPQTSEFEFFKGGTTTMTYHQNGNYAAGKRNRTPPGRAVPGRERPRRSKGCDRGAALPFRTCSRRILFP